MCVYVKKENVFSFIYQMMINRVGKKLSTVLDGIHRVVNNIEFEFPKTEILLTPLNTALRLDVFKLILPITQL